MLRLKLRLRLRLRLRLSLRLSLKIGGVSVVKGVDLARISAKGEASGHRRTVELLLRRRGRVEQPCVTSRISQAPLTKHTRRWNLRHPHSLRQNPTRDKDPHGVLYRRVASKPLRTTALTSTVLTLLERPQTGSSAL